MSNVSIKDLTQSAKGKSSVTSGQLRGIQQNPLKIPSRLPAEPNRLGGASHDPLYQKIGYGAAETGIVAVELFIQVYLLNFFTSVVGLKPSFAGLALALAVVIDAITDPIMGIISDQFKRRTGKRRIFVIAGGIALGFAFPILFYPFSLPSQWDKLIFLLVSYSFVNVAMTVIAVPHSALGAEISTNPSTRTVLYGSKMLWGNLGLLIGLLVPGFLIQSISASNDIVLAQSAIVVSGIVVVMAFLTYFTTDDSPFHSFSNIKTFTVTTARYSYFFKIFTKVSIPLFVSFFIATIGRTMNSSLALYYYDSFLGIPRESVILQVLGLFILVLSVSIPLWIWISKRWGKKWPAFGGIFSLGALTASTYLFFPKGEIQGPLTMAVLGGLFAASIVLLDSLVADIVDYDSLKANQTREGLLFGVWKMISKVSRAIGLALTGFLLDAMGFVEGSPTQSPGTSYSIAFLFGPGVGILFMTGAIVFAFFPWSNEAHSRVRRILGKRGN